MGLKMMPAVSGSSRAPFMVSWFRGRSLVALSENRMFKDLAAVHTEQMAQHLTRHEYAVWVDLAQQGNQSMHPLRVAARPAMSGLN